MLNFQFLFLIIGALLKDSAVQTLLWGVWGFGLAFGFRFAVRKDRELTTDEVITIAPHATGIRWSHQVLGSVWALSSLVGLLGFDSWFTQGRFISPLVLGIVFSSLAAFDGFFAARTGIYSVSERWRFRYVVDNGTRIRQLGRMQGWLGAVTCGAGIISAHLIPHS